MEEARSSANFKKIDTSGVEIMWTLRDADENKLKQRVDDFLAILGMDVPASTKKTATTPQTEKKAPSDACPKCGSPLVTFQSKDGRTHLKCSTAGWDNVRKQSTGCSYIRWSNDKEETYTIGDGATPAQQKVIQNNWPELWRDGMTKAEARKIIDENKDW